MRISDRIMSVALLSAGLGLASAFAFDGTQSDGIAPAATVDVVPRNAVTAPALAPPGLAAPGLTVPTPAIGAGSLGAGSLRTPEIKRSLTPVEAFRSGTRALRAGDAQAGISALEYAAEKGHPIAQWKLGRMYADGDQVKRDDLKAFRYFRDIIDAHGDDAPGTTEARFVANAFVAVGTYYLDGIANSSVKPDAERARQMFAYAASYYGDADAQYRLGRMMLEGQGGGRDVWQAARWLKLAADKGQYQAQALLGATLFKGQLMPRQGARGLMYLTLARDAAPQDKTVAELQAAASQQATDDERALALSYLEAWLKGRRD
jgi:TPR repeat protein